MVGIGVIGYGYWGPNLVRNFTALGNCRVVAVSDMRPQRLADVRLRYPGAETATDYREVLAKSSVDAVAIATPVSTHYELAMLALQAGKHVLLEKPMTATPDEARRLIEEAERRRLVLLVDHTFVYTGAVRKIKELLGNDGLGDIYYYDSVRVNLGLFQPDVSVVWDLAVHDLSIMDYVLPGRPSAVAAFGTSHIPGRPEDVAYITMSFDGALLGHLHVNWLAPVKIRRTLIGGSRKMIVYDDLEPSEKVKVYDKGITVNDSPDSVYQRLVGYRTGDMWAPQVDLTEALHIEALHFLRCIEEGEVPLTGGRAGLRVVQILDAASKSLAARGRPVELTQD